MLIIFNIMQDFLRKLVWAVLLLWCNCWTTFNFSWLEFQILLPLVVSCWVFLPFFKWTRIECIRAGTVVTHALQPCTIFCGALLLTHSVSHTLNKVLSQMEHCGLSTESITSVMYSCVWTLQGWPCFTSCTLPVHQSFLTQHNYTLLWWGNCVIHCGNDVSGWPSCQPYRTNARCSGNNLLIVMDCC
jgi:hypothetical protein